MTFTALLSALYLALSDASPWAMLLKIGVLITFTAFFWSFTDKYFWRHRRIRQFLFNGIPDLNGRWEGTIDRDGEQAPHAFVLEIRQTLTRVTLDGYSAAGGGPSITARMCVDDSGEKFALLYTWFCETRTELDGARSGWFLGTSVLDWLPSNQLKRFYYTGRQPRQTRGVTELRFISTKLKHAF
ncbi:MAG: hypothetical protein H7144_10570 [Burkholderiales bacterium]|nr:hypothetical protein [Phycisphaerae bacterium]